jgi:subtilase family serine protease
MNLRISQLVGLLGIAALAACAGGSNTALPSGSAPISTQSNYIASCDTAPAGSARCFSLVRTDVGGGALPGTAGGRTTLATSPSGYGPADIQSAYKLPSTTAGSGQTIAIVDAYDLPTAENDLGVYRTQFGLPACTTANGCFKKVGQTGGAVPKANGSWGQEIALDLDMVSATCPNCHILLVEANSATNANLATAVNEAIALGANVVSNSYGGSETGASNSAYDHPGHVITASAGDSGTGPSQPCSYSTVVCIGGTNLQHASNTRGWAETAWTSSGSGCSAQVAKPSWQTDGGTGNCNMRSESDVSAVADPNTGVSVYDSTTYRGQGGWMVFGGTSVSSPLIAGVYGLAGNASSQNYASNIWAGAGANLNDVTSGSNGSCSISYICNARAGYDGPTGWGTPNTAAAF